MVSTRQPTRNPDFRVCAHDYAMGATLTPISPTLRHRPQKSTCRSVARNNQFPCEGNEIVGKGGGRGGERNEGGRQNWCSRQSVVSGFFSVSRAGFFVGIFGSEKKLRGTLLLDPLPQSLSAHNDSPCIYSPVVHLTMQSHGGNTSACDCIAQFLPWVDLHVKIVHHVTHEAMISYILFLGR